MLEQCAVLDWAASGAMALTGRTSGPPTASPAPVLRMLKAVTQELAQATGKTGTRVQADPAELITGRAALMRFTRRGQVSAGGSSFLLRCANGWCAVTLSRPVDLAAVPAILGVLGLDSADLSTGERQALAAAALVRPAEDLADAAQLLGVPAAALPQVTSPSPGAWPPWRTVRIAPSSSGARLSGALVVDLSSMWAGPLCARLLGLGGAHVIKVESPDRPDGARSGNPEFFDWLHAGHRSLMIDFRSLEGRAVLKELLDAADIVIESSRPRALAALGLAPDLISHPDGQVWVSITGYGRAAPERVAFGDDAAVAGRLVGWTNDGSSEPVFCADAIADPLTGACAALAASRSIAVGGGELIDLSMREVAAAFAVAPSPAHGAHQVQPDGIVTCPRSGRQQAILPPLRHSPSASLVTPRAPKLGADTSAVRTWLAARTAAC
jgi:hypothetical protein